MANNISKNSLLLIEKMQQNEITEGVIYQKIAAFAKGEENKATLLRLSAEELAHCDIWTQYTGKTLKPQKPKVFWYTLMARILGFTFMVKLMEKGESIAQDEYALLAQEAPESIEIRHSLNLASDISINYAVVASQLSSYDSFYLECELPVYEGNALVGSRTVKVEPVLNSFYYYFTLTGITAVNMADEISATLIMERNGQTYTSAEDRYSISTYAYSQLNKDTATEELKALCAELLRYGSAAKQQQSAKRQKNHRLFVHGFSSSPFDGLPTVC